MQRLLDDFDKLFDLDHRVRGARLGDLIRRSIEELEQQELPDWGSSGPADRFDREQRGGSGFYYTPHLFPGMELHLRLAHKLQFYMLPREVPPSAPLSLSAVLESYCHLSGDLFGWEMLSDGRFLTWIVDLSGHGVPSGLASAVLRVLIGNLRQRARVGALVTELNDNFVGCLRADQDSLFATGFFMVVSPHGSTCYVSAGHPPVLVRKDDGRIETLSPTSIPIGMFEGRAYEAEETRLRPGDMLLLYTDGLVELANGKGEMFGVDRLRELLREEIDAPKALARALYRRVAEHQDLDELNDDVTFVAARMS